MTTKANQNQEDQEIDLALIFKKIESLFDGVKAFIYKKILFFKKNVILLSSLFIIGGSLGAFFDINSKTYAHEIIVSPNLGGTDYLYAKIDFLSSKLNENDAFFLKSIGIKNPSDIGSIKIEPVVDIYNFVNNSTSAASAVNTQNFELVKLLAEDASLKDVIKDKLTSKNYPNHKIEIITSEKLSKDKVIKPILKFLNTDEYYNKILKISRENILIKMEKNEQEIVQIDSILKVIVYNLKQNKNQNLIYNNENNQINPLFELKNSLINEIASQKIILENFKVFIKDSSTTINISNTKGINGKLKFILPLLLILGFILLSFLKNFYKKQEALSLLK